MINSVYFQSQLYEAIALICKTGGWDYGEAWIPCPEGVLELSPVWYSRPDTEEIEKFRLCSEAFVIPPNQGLPGRVWAKGQPEWIVDVSARSETYFLRNQIAKACGVKAGFGIPIKCDRQIIVVLVFFMQTAGDRNQQTVDFITAVAAELEQALSHSPALI
ncbi:GAF domain-containing protein [Synechocystis sp. PCC 7509]|uniref:GAF domain-containing protein n=1 Tax=Synechocystis sp. PCC 7509 TaxID=927677 RepID=UPI0002ABFD79|nr:GAF domain-containing protein [Synechocystis sp. PCC 7509]